MIAAGIRQGREDALSSQVKGILMKLGSNKFALSSKEVEKRTGAY